MPNAGSVFIGHSVIAHSLGIGRWELGIVRCRSGVFTMPDASVWSSSADVTWCPGCGNFGVLNALRQALAASKLEPWQVVVVSGIGQSGKMPHYLGCNFLHGLHGRALPGAIGVKLANRSLKVICIGGDGDLYGEGGNHLVHAFRRNVDIVCLTHNNGVYGLTKGQASPTLNTGTRLVPAFNPLAAGLAAGGTFLARGFAGDVKQLARLIGDALKHNGFAFVDILQPCVTYNKVNTFQWYKQRVYDLALDNHDLSDVMAARARVLEWPGPKEDRIPTGIFYRSRRAVYEEMFPALKKRTLVEHSTDIEQVKKLLGEFR
jgi:2-oxoglutarate ferredoxin oxidoreductase subunit beta